MKRVELDNLLLRVGACQEAREWVKAQPGTVREVWNACENPSFLFWICGALKIERKIIAFAACQCARLALRYVKEGEERPRLCIETTESYLRGEATIDQVMEARSAAADAAYAAYAAAAYAAYAAYAAAAYAAYAAYAAAYADDDAAADAAAADAAAADAAADAAAADADAAYAARQKMRKDCCNAIRAAIPFSSLLRAAKTMMEDKA